MGKKCLVLVMSICIVMTSVFLPVLPAVAAASLDDSDKTSFNPGPGPMDSTPDNVSLTQTSYTHPAGPVTLSLDGTWQLAENGDEASRLNSNWTDAINATVPGSVHTALQNAGVIPNPKFAKNDATARGKTFLLGGIRKPLQGRQEL